LKESFFLKLNFPLQLISGTQISVNALHDDLERDSKNEFKVTLKRSQTPPGKFSLFRVVFTVVRPTIFLNGIQWLGNEQLLDDGDIIHISHCNREWDYEPQVLFEGLFFSLHSLL